MTPSGRNPGVAPSSFRRKVEELKAEIDFEQVFQRMAEIERSFADLDLCFEPIPRDAKKGS